VAAIRAELRCLLVHPAITPERRSNADPFLKQCQAVAQLLRWQQLLLQQCAAWEDAALAAEQAQNSGPLPTR